MAAPRFVLGKDMSMFDAEWSLHGGESVPQFPRRNQGMIGHSPIPEKPVDDRKFLQFWTFRQFEVDCLRRMDFCDWTIHALPHCGFCSPRHCRHLCKRPRVCLRSLGGHSRGSLSRHVGRSAYTNCSPLCAQRLRTDIVQVASLRQKFLISRDID